MWVISPIIDRLVPSPSRYEIRHITGCVTQSLDEWKFGFADRHGVKKKQDLLVNIGKNLADKYHPHANEAQTMDLSDLYNRVTPTISDFPSFNFRLARDLNKLKPRKAPGPDGI